MLQLPYHSNIGDGALPALVVSRDPVEFLRSVLNRLLF